MKKLLILGVIGMFSISSFAKVESLQNKVEMEKTLLKVAADFPVYCDGVYAGNASTIEEAVAMCD